jgi:hypothetical protein
MKKSTGTVRPKRARVCLVPPALKPYLGAGATLLQPDPEAEAKTEKQMHDQREWLLFRLDKIEECYHTSEAWHFLNEVWRRVSRPGFNDWTPSDLRDFTILNNVHDLDREASLARETIKAGDVWNNQHFRNVQQLNEALSSLFNPELKRGLQNARERQKGVDKVKDNKTSSYAKICAFWKELEATTTLLRKERIVETAKKFKVSTRTVERAIRTID